MHFRSACDVSRGSAVVSTIRAAFRRPVRRFDDLCGVSTTCAAFRRLCAAKFKPERKDHMTNLFNRQFNMLLRLVGFGQKYADLFPAAGLQDREMPSSSR